MSIRQQRLNSPDKIRERISNLIGQKVTLVLENRTSVLGEIKAVEADAVTIVNGSLKKNRYSFADISELYFDQIV